METGGDFLIVGGRHLFEWKDDIGGGGGGVFDDGATGQPLWTLTNATRNRVGYIYNIHRLRFKHIPKSFLRLPFFHFLRLCGWVVV